MKKQLLYVVAIALLASCSKPAVDENPSVLPNDTTKYGGAGYNPGTVGGGGGSSPTGFYFSATINGTPYTSFFRNFYKGSAGSGMPVTAFPTGHFKLTNGDTVQFGIVIAGYTGAGTYTNLSITGTNFNYNNITVGPAGGFSGAIFTNPPSKDINISIISDDGKIVSGGFSGTVYDVYSVQNGNPALDSIKITNGSFRIQY